MISSPPYPTTEASATLSPAPLPVASANSLPEVVKSFMDGQDVWEDTATELLSTLEGTYDGLPVDGTRLSVRHCSSQRRS